MSEDWLLEAAGGNAGLLATMRQRVQQGEPPAYVAGFLYFRGRRFRSDPRAYVTDPELSSLIDRVLMEGDRFEAEYGRAPQVLDFGVGAGTLGITLKLERPAWTLCGLDIDADALSLAAENASLHGVELPLWHSDMLSGWPQGRPPPDLIFGDPPWGSETDLYTDEGRDADYYHRMPAASAYPKGGRTAIHDGLVAAVVARGWPSLLVLNYGVLPEAVIERSARALNQRRIERPVPGVSHLVGRSAA